MTINATHIGEKIDGIGRFSLIIAKYFIQDGYKVAVNKNALTHFSKKERDNLEIVDKKVSPDYGFKGHILRLLYTNRLKGKILNLSQLEISFWNKKQIVVVHDIIPLLFPKYHKKQYHFFKYILPFILKYRVSHIVTVSNHTKELLINKYKISNDKITVIYNGIDTRCKECKKENYFLFVGRDSPTKNIDRLVEAFSLIENRDIKLILVGVKRTFGDQRVVSLGYIDENQLRELYSKAKYFIFPTLYEGFGFPALEAMRCKCATIVSKAGSLPEVCKEGALYVDEYSVKDIANKMRDLINNKNLCKKIVDRGYTISKEYNWDKSYKQYKEVISS